MRLQHSISLIFLSLIVGAFCDANIVKFCWQLDLVHVVVVPVLEVLLQRHRGHGRQTRGPRRQHQHAAGQQSGPRLERGQESEDRTADGDIHYTYLLGPHLPADNLGSFL